MKAKQALLEKIKDGSFALLTAEETAKKLRLSRTETNGLRAMLDSLVREGELLCDSRLRYGTAKQFGAVQGKICGNERGFAFFVPDDGSDDLFLPRRALCGALHGDGVLAMRVSSGRSNDEGEVLAVLSRGYGEIVGTYLTRQRGGVLRPDEKRFAAEILIPQNKRGGCKNGDKAVARITSYEGRSLTGEIVEVLGGGGELFTEERALFRAHGLREEFPKEALSEAEKQARRNPEKELDGRVDLRDKLIVTVDGEDTRDIDDAISVEKRGGRYYLGVHIADVSHYVTRGSELDKEAFLRGTSAYFPDRVLPMLPPALSNGICSLNEGVTRLTLSCFMTVDGKGNVLEKRVSPSVIRSRRRMTYAEITAIARREKSALKKYPDLTETVAAAIELTQILKAARDQRGGIDLELKEAKILYRDGEISVPASERTISHEMIEQFMVLANENVARLMGERGMPFIYRVHEKPSEEKARDFREFLKDAGVRAAFDPTDVSPRDYRELLTSLQTSPIRTVVSRVMLRSMMKAFYSPENVGHFGLASPCYCHFTSPIRRYPDLCIHRIIKDALTAPAGEKALRNRYASFVKNASVRASVCEKNAAEAEREVDALYIVFYMHGHIGEEYGATVSGVTSYGIFAELENTVEGFVPIETLPDDSYEYSEERFFLRGTRNSFRLGEKIRVKVVGVDIGLRRVQFSFLEKLAQSVSFSAKT